MKIIFFGTPLFASKILEDLYHQNRDVISVVTLPDRRKGRGKKTSSTAVKEKAEELGIKCYTPEKINDNKFIGKLRQEKADLFIVVAFRFLPKEIFNIPKYGTVNLHASLLPEYRGAAPINRVLINGEKHTGITTFIINDKIDTGKMLLQEEIKLSSTTTAAQLHNEMIDKGSLLISKTIDGIKSNTLIHKQQDNMKASYAPKLNKEMMKVNWDEPAMKIQNLIRGLSPYISERNYLKDVSIFPSAYFNLQISENEQIRIKIIYSKLEKNKEETKNSIETDNKSFLKINIKDGSINILDIQIPGKNIMDIKTFLSGNKVNPNWKII